MNDQPVASLHLTREDATRLFEKADTQLRLSSLPRERLEWLLKTVLNGLSRLASYDARATPWKQCANLLIEMLDADQLACGRSSPPPSHLSAALARRANPLFAPQERPGAELAAATAFLRCAFGGIDLGKDPADNLRKLLELKDGDWRRFRLAIPEGLGDVHSQLTSKSGPEIAKELQALFEGNIPSIDRILRGDTIEESPPEVDQEAEPGSAHLSYFDSDPDDEAAHHNEHFIEGDEVDEDDDEEEPDLTPDVTLLARLQQRLLDGGLLDPLRLGLQVRRLTFVEVKRAIEPHVLTLRQPMGHTRQDWVFSLVRLLSLCCATPLKTCLRIPVVRTSGTAPVGTLHVDADLGVIRRCGKTMVPRKSNDLAPHQLWWELPLPTEVSDGLRALTAAHPEAQSLGQLLAAEEMPWQECRRRLNPKDWPSSRLPEDARFAYAFRHVFAHIGCHPAVTRWLTGDTGIIPPAADYYLNFPGGLLSEATAAVYAELGLTCPHISFPERVGSPKWRSAADLKALLDEVVRQVVVARTSLSRRTDAEENLEAYFEFHNLYTACVVLLICASVVGRVTLLDHMTFARIMAKQGQILVGDRRVDLHTQLRVCPVTERIVLLQASYLEHLLALAKILKKRRPRAAAFLNKLAKGHYPDACAFYCFQTRTGLPRNLHAGTDPSDPRKTAKFAGLRPLKRLDIYLVMRSAARRCGQSFRPTDLNLFRHYTISRLVEWNVPQVAVEALVGHHIQNSETFSSWSGVSVRAVMDFLRPYLSTIEEEVGITPVAGLGRQDLRLKKDGSPPDFPQMQVPPDLAPPPNESLRRKMAARDHLIPEITRIVADPTAADHTLVAHSKLETLALSYLSGDQVRRLPLGSALFCLIAMELVSTTSEQESLLEAAFSDGFWTIGRMSVVEACSAERDQPTLQRILGPHTTLALIKAREKVQHSSEMIPVCQQELHQLLRELDSAWPASSTEESSRLLANIAAHWGVIEVARGTLLTAFHKTPLLPASTLARIAEGRPELRPPKESAHKVAKRHSNDGFQRVRNILNEVANHDQYKGEEQARVSEVRTKCAELVETETCDLFELTLIQLVLADLSDDAPYEKIALSTVLGYLSSYERFFTFARIWDDLDLDEEDYLAVFESLVPAGQDIPEPSASGPQRWPMLHICAFMQRAGHPGVPPVFLADSAQKVPLAPRPIVYITKQEVAMIVALLDDYFRSAGGTYSWAGFRFALQRSVPTRIGEIRYSTPKDLDPEAALFNIRATGHNHQKTRYSSGPAMLPVELLEQAKQLLEDRRLVDVGPSTKLFGDAQSPRPFEAFDKITEVTAILARAISGCPEWRPHDQRANAATDLAFAVEKEVRRLYAGECLPSPQILSADELIRQQSRFALAARNARHASPLTTLRYYIASGPLDLRQSLDIAQAEWEVGSAYAAAAVGSSISALNTYEYRARRGLHKKMSEAA